MFGTQCVLLLVNTIATCGQYSVPSPLRKSCQGVVFAFTFLHCGICICNQTIFAPKCFIIIIIIMFLKGKAYFLFIDPQDEVGPSVVQCSFVLLVYIVVLVLVVCFCPSSVRVVATFSVNVLFVNNIGHHQYCLFSTVPRYTDSMRWFYSSFDN